MTDRALTLVIVLVILLVLGGLGVRAWLAPPPPVAVTPVAEEIVVDKTHTGARVRVVSCQRDPDRAQIRMEGYVENIGNVELHYVTVKSIWKDQAGTVLAEGELYALNNEILAPGDRKIFTDFSERYGVARCNADAVDWW